MDSYTDLMNQYEMVKEEIDRYKRYRDAWKAKAFRLIDFLNKKDKEIKRLRRVGKQMVSYFTSAREGYMGDHKVKCDIQANVKFVNEWVQALKEKDGS